MIKNNFAKTKIVCTIGPVSESKDMLTKLTKAGMNVMRLNFSHGTYEEHERKIKLMTEVNEELNTKVAIMLDTQGPEIRTGFFENGEAVFKKGQKVVLVPDNILGTSACFSVTYKKLYRDVKPGGKILLYDGKITLEIESVEEDNIICKCLNAGTITDRRIINVLGVKLGMNFLSEKDIEDIKFGCQQPINFIAASYTRRAQDIFDIKKLLIQNNRNDIHVIAKIENNEGLDNLDEILNVADGVMVIRGDLGIEVPDEDVPFIQKEIIRKCKESGKVVITATQMLDSMQVNPRPTRAEVSDVANAIFDGTDALMLSGESAHGKYPEEAVRTMHSIAYKIEQSLDYDSLHAKAMKSAKKNTSEAICMSVAEIAIQFNVAAIVTFTHTGLTARSMSRYSTKAKIIAITPKEHTAKQLSLHWGILPVISPTIKERNSMIDYAKIVAKEHGVQEGEIILVTGGNNGIGGDTSFLELILI